MKWGFPQILAQSPFLFSIGVFLVITATIVLLATILPGLSIGQGYGLSFVAWLLYGGAFTTQHYSIRLWLWRCRFAPLRLVPFLEAAVGYRLLRRVGGGYIFVHRTLVDWFDALSEDEIKRLVSPQ